MGKPVRMMTAALMASCLVIALAAASVSANRALGISPAGQILATSSGVVTFTGGGFSATCSVTLEGEIKPSTPKTSRNVVGFLTVGATSGCREAFGTTTVAFLATDEAPVNLTYTSFLGSLPTITGVLLTATGLSGSVTNSLAGTCLYQGDVGFLVTFPPGRESGNRISILRNSLARSRGGALCPATLEMTGSLNLTPGQTLTLLNAQPPPVVRIVTVGDSYISGEAGRWAGNTGGESGRIDAGTPNAYFDNAGHLAELIPRCHRSKAAEAYIVPDAIGLNLACSGAKITSAIETYFKPGLDRYNNGLRRGQALMLQNYAARNQREVKLVVISIGGNDFGFGEVVSRCIRAYLFITIRRHCSLQAAVLAKFNAAAITAKTRDIETGIKEVSQAMTNAGYAAADYKILIQNYMSPIPSRREEFRYPERTGGRVEPEEEAEVRNPWEERGPEEFEIEAGEENYRAKTRQSTGGCGFWNRDAEWANATALPTINTAIANAIVASGITNGLTLRLETAFEGRRLCENANVKLLEEWVPPLANWMAAGASDRTEWINQIRTISTIGPNYFLQEGLHPNYWAQLALRNCLRRAFNRDAPRSGTCRLNGLGLEGTEPRMQLI